MKILQIISNQIFFNHPKIEAAENIKIIYSVFSRTIEVDSLKTFAEEGSSTNKLRRILKATGTPDNEIQAAMNKSPIVCALDCVEIHVSKSIIAQI